LKQRKSEDAGNYGVVTELVKEAIKMKMLEKTVSGNFVSEMLKKLLSVAMIMSVLILSTMMPQAATGEENYGPAKTIKKIRRELVTLPFYGVFDNLSFTYEDGIVTLLGEVVRPTTRKDAERRVEQVAGVEQVINKIKVLPLSTFDDRIRIATYRAVYSQPGLDRLSFQAQPPIRIIVDRGNITLEGVVASKADATRAYIAARGVPNAFTVTNNLRVEKKS
jgi:hyperosmotically inducible protein